MEISSHPFRISLSVVTVLFLMKDQQKTFFDPLRKYFPINHLALDYDNKQNLTS